MRKVIGFMYETKKYRYALESRLPLPRSFLFNFIRKLYTVGTAYGFKDNSVLYLRTQNRIGVIWGHAPWSLLIGDGVLGMVLGTFFA